MIRVIASADGLADVAEQLQAALASTTADGTLTLTSATKVSELAQIADASFRSPVPNEAVLGVGVILSPDITPADLARADLALRAATEEAALRLAPSARAVAVMISPGCDFSRDAVKAIEFLWTNRSLTGQVLRLTPSGRGN